MQLAEAAVDTPMVVQQVELEQDVVVDNSLDKHQQQLHQTQDQVAVEVTILVEQIMVKTEVLVSLFLLIQTQSQHLQIFLDL
jgi:hypothetical protein